MRSSFIRSFAVAALFLVAALLLPAQTHFTVGTYNLEKYFVKPTDDFETKSHKTVESLVRLNADVLGLVEIGNRESTTHLLKALQAEGLDYPYYEWMSSNDGTLNLAVFSRYPLTQTVRHKKDHYTLGGTIYSPKRGFLETQVQVTDDYSFTVLLTHLKSQVESKKESQEEIRLEEAKLLRKKVDALLKKDPDADFVLMGDLNDDYSSRPLRTLLGYQKGVKRLADARPIEPIGDTLPEERTRGKFRSIAWTHFYSAEDSYSRLDYILYSPGLRNQFEQDQTWIAVVPNWGQASDHRPIRAGFSLPKKED